MIDLKLSDNLVCPYCQYEYKTSIEEVRSSEGLGLENADTEQCEECNERFLIVEFEDYVSIEEIEEDEDDDDFED